MAQDVGVAVRIVGGECRVIKYTGRECMVIGAGKYWMVRGRSARPCAVCGTRRYVLFKRMSGRVWSLEADGGTIKMGAEQRICSQCARRLHESHGGEVEDYRV